MKYLRPDEITDEMVERAYSRLCQYDADETPGGDVTRVHVRGMLTVALCDRRKGERRAGKEGLTAMKDAPEPNPCPKHGYDFYPACKHCYLSALRSTITPTVPEVSEGMRREWARAVYLKHLEEQAIK